MSYVEHGPRIFLAASRRGDTGHGEPLIYGDYVLPRKRSEGRLKVYESCTDIRAWSQNALESSRYFRELTEHAKTPGKVVPMDVVIDNVIGLGAQTQNELVACRRELQKYKNLKLTAEQQRQLRQGSPNPPKSRSRSQPTSGSFVTTRGRSSSPIPPQIRGTVNRSLQTDVPVLRSRSVSAGRLVNTTQELSFQAEVRDRRAARDTVTRFDPPGLDDRGGIRGRSDDDDFQTVPTTTSSQVTKTDDLQSDDFTSTDDEFVDQRNPKAVSRRKLRVTLSTTDKSGESYSTSGRSERTETGTESISRSGTTTSGTESESDDETNKATIIQKDSEIIALKNELGAKEMELDELRELNRLFEESLKAREEDVNLLRQNMQMLNQQMAGMGDQTNYETEKLKKMIAAYEYEISELTEELKGKSSSCRSQARELEELRYQVKEAEMMRLERDSLAKKLEDMGKLLVDANRYSQAMNELKTVLRERDELRSQNREQSCLLADQEDEIKKLLLVLQRTSSKYENRQVKLRGAIETMRNEIEQKDCKICCCEEQLNTMQREFTDLNVQLKTSLNSMDEFKIAYEDACNCADVDQDIYSEAKNALCRLNLTMGELKAYKIERVNLLEQIEDLKKQITGNNDNVTIYCQRGSPNDDIRGAVQQPVSDFTTLNLRKRKCLIREELEDVEEELRRRGEKSPVAYAMSGDEDVVASAKYTIDRLNNAMQHFDTWQLEKASLEETIEKLQMKLTTLERAGEENVEWQLVDQASTAVVKIRRLMNELQNYRCERDNMRRRIKNLTADLEDAQSAASCKGMSLLKERIREIRIENETEREALLTQIRNLERRVDEAENTSSCSGVRALRLKLRQALLETSNDRRIDQALATHVKKSIEGIVQISEEIKGVAEDRAKIAKEIAKQQREIQVRNVEIVKLKQEVEMHVIERKGEGDRAGQNLIILAETKEQLDRQNAAIRGLEGKLESYELQILGSEEERGLLKDRIEELVEKNTKLSSDNQVKKIDLENKETEILRLVGKLSALRDDNSTKNDLKKEISGMKSRLTTLQKENGKLMREVATLNGVLSERNESILMLMAENDANLKTIATNATNYEKSLNEREIELKQLQRRNKRSDDKLKEAEDRIRSLNGTLSVLDTKNEKLEQISMLHEEISRLTSDKKKLEAEMKRFKVQLSTHESSNKKLEDDLNDLCGENDSLKSDITHLTAENVRLSSELVGQVSVKEQLLALPDKLHKDILALKERLRTTEADTSDALYEARDKMNQLQIKRAEDAALIDELQRQIKLQAEQLLIQEEKIVVLEKANGELRTELTHRLDELKDSNNRMKLIRKDMTARKKQSSRENLSARLSGEKMMKHLWEELESMDCKSKSESVLETNRVGEITCKLNHLENENKQLQTEINKLLCDVKFKNTEIESLKEDLKSIIKERDVLNDTIKIITVQNNKSLQAVKMRYEGNLKLMHESHNESVARLQSQYEEVIKDGSHFDPESWLRSLNLNEISELHNRICMASSCAFTIGELSERSSNGTDPRKNPDMTDKNESNRRIATLENEIVKGKQDAQEKINELEKELNIERGKVKEITDTCAREQQRCVELQNQLHRLKNQSPYRIENPTRENHRTLSNYEKKLTNDLQSDIMDSSGAEKVHDWRKKNFIYQCSMYKK